MRGEEEKNTHKSHFSKSNQESHIQNWMRMMMKEFKIRREDGKRDGRRRRGRAPGETSEKYEKILQLLQAEKKEEKLVREMERAD